jgi:anti-sigma factor RsiW
MSECWDEGGLRAYFDRELPPEDLTRIAGHLGGCAECHARYNELAVRATRVSSMMNALAMEPGIAPAQFSPKRQWMRPVAAAVLALAAAATLAFVLLPKRAAQPRPVASPHTPRVERPIQAEVAARAPERSPSKAAHAKLAHSADEPQTDYYLALDDEPIDVGVVMRVALDGDLSVQADVVFDGQGRARAIRPVKQLSK